MLADKPKYTALIMAAGLGTRMHAAEKKQFMDLNGKPVIWHTIRAFEENGYIDNIVITVAVVDVRDDGFWAVVF